MSEREILIPQKEGWFPAEIKKPYKKEITLEEHFDGLLINTLFIVSYKYSWKKDKLLIGRERTIPAKVEKSEEDFMFPYPNLESLRGQYGVLIYYISKNPYRINVGKDYRITFCRSYIEDYQKFADIDVESRFPINIDFIDGRINYNEFLKNLHSGN